MTSLTIGAPRFVPVAGVRRMRVADVQRELGVSRTRVLQLDMVLAPERLPNGDRIYEAALVEAYRRRRDATMAARAR